MTTLTRDEWRARARAHEAAVDEQLEGRCEIAYLPRTPEIGSFDRTRPCGEGQEEARETLAR